MRSLLIGWRWLPNDFLREPPGFFFVRSELLAKQQRLQLADRITRIYRRLCGPIELIFILFFCWVVNNAHMKWPDNCFVLETALLLNALRKLTKIVGVWASLFPFFENWTRSDRSLDDARLDFPQCTHTHTRHPGRIQNRCKFWPVSQSPYDDNHSKRNHCRMIERHNCWLWRQYYGDVCEFT